MFNEDIWASVFKRRFSNQLKNRLKWSEMNFQLDLRHSCCYCYNACCCHDDFAHCHHHFARRCHCHYFSRHATSCIRILSYFPSVFLPSQSRRSEPCTLLVGDIFIWVIFKTAFDASNNSVVPYIGIITDCNFHPPAQHN